jgi:hypothetical protein
VIEALSVYIGGPSRKAQNEMATREKRKEEKKKKAKKLCYLDSAEHLVFCGFKMNW